MKKCLLLFLLLLLMAGTFSACGGDDEPYIPVPTIVGDAIQSFDVGLALWPGNERLRDQIWAGLQVLSAQGVVDRLSHRWLGESVLDIPPNGTALLPFGEILPRTLIIGVNPEMAPFAFLDAEGNFMGLDVDLAQALCELLGWELIVIPILWADREFHLNSGNIDVLWSANLTESMLRRTIHTPGFWENEQVIVTMSDANITRHRDLRESYIGVQEGSISEYAAYVNAERLGTIVQYDTQSRLIWAVETKRMPAMVLDYHTARFLMSRFAAG